MFGWPVRVVVSEFGDRDRVLVVYVVVAPTCGGIIIGDVRVHPAAQVSALKSAHHIYGHQKVISFDFCFQRHKTLLPLRPSKGPFRESSALALPTVFLSCANFAVFDVRRKKNSYRASNWHRRNVLVLKMED